MAELKVGVVIPWREEPTRVPAFNAVTEWYSKNLSNAKVFLSDSPYTVWNMSASRNIGVSLARSSGCEVIVLNDADTFPQLDPLLESIEAAYNDNKIHLPYTEYRFLYESDTKKFFNGVPLERCTSHILSENSCSGVNVFSPQAWDEIGGGDEKFYGWGYDDTAMNYVHEIVHGSPYTKHIGKAYALSHKTQPLYDQNALNNRALFEIYKSKDNKQDVLDLVKSKAIK